jgi:hypothetical protein
LRGEKKERGKTKITPKTMVKKEKKEKKDRKIEIKVYQKVDILWSSSKHSFLLNILVNSPLIRRINSVHITAWREKVLCSALNQESFSLFPMHGIGSRSRSSDSTNRKFWAALEELPRDKEAHRRTMGFTLAEHANQKLAKRHSSSSSGGGERRTRGRSHRCDRLGRPKRTRTDWRHRTESGSMRVRFQSGLP